MGNTVLILGNGFDINIGLDTRYSDFLKSSYFVDYIKGNNLFKYINEINTKNNWVDLELELSNHSKNNKDDKSFKREYELLVKNIGLFISDLVNKKKINKNSSAYKFIENELKNSDNIEIFTFNYTSIIEEIVEDMGYNKGINYIHGSIIEKNIVLGTHDSEFVSENHSFLFKSGSLNFKGLNFTRHISSATKIIIFGHSLGDSDSIYFKNIIDSLWFNNESNWNNKEIIIYYHDENSRLNLIYQLQKLSNFRLSNIATNPVKSNELIWKDVKSIE